MRLICASVCVCVCVCAACLGLCVQFFSHVDATCACAWRHPLQLVGLEVDGAPTDTVLLARSVDHNQVRAVRTFCAVLFSQDAYIHTHTHTHIHTYTHTRIDAANLFIVCDQWLFVTESAAVLVSTQTLQTTAEWRPEDGKVLCCVGGAVLSLLALLLARSFPLSRALHTRWRVIMPHPPPPAVCVRLTADSHACTATADWRVLSQRYTARCFRWPAYRRVWHCCRCSQRHR